MKMYDVTAPIFEGMPVYKNKPEKQPKLTTVTNDYVTESRIDMDVHTGTHIDAPLHMVKTEKRLKRFRLKNSSATAKY